MNIGATLSRCLVRQIPKRTSLMASSTRSAPRPVSPLHKGTIRMAAAVTTAPPSQDEPATSQDAPVQGTPIRDAPADDVAADSDAATSKHSTQSNGVEKKGQKKPREQRQREQREKQSQEALITPVGDMWPRPYVIDEDLRRVEPYHFTYNTWCKERWRGRTLIDIFASEFRDRPLEYYRAAMERGDIFVNSKVVGPDYVVRNGDKVSHTMHRHEPPVTSDPIGVIHEDDDMIVIDKPAGVPVHPAGRYNFNSITEIMRAERGPDFFPYPCNRLDRLTSGIMFVAKNIAAAEALGVQIKGRSVRKEYIARVVGEFPEGEVVCDQPILSISPKLGLNRVRANGKSARTVFKRLAYYPPPGGGSVEPASGTPASENHSAAAADDGRGRSGGADGRGTPWVNKKGYSIVRCLPVTGRTHQLRVHLQHLGHPIQNDPIYANMRVWGFDLGQDDPDGTHTTDEDVISRLSRMGKEEVAQAVVYYDEMVEKYEKRRAEKMTGELCSVCQTPLYSDPGPHELSLWLHSLRYEDAHGSWAYVSPLPRWALPPDGVSGPTTVGGMDELVEAVKTENPELAS